jgi:hypothetical protein
MKLRYLLFLLTVSIAQCFCQPIPTEIKLMVAYIYMPDNTGRPIPNGTAFFVGVKDTSKPDRFAVYIVTAKHVLQLDDRRTFFHDILIRVNKRAGDAEFLHLELHPTGAAKNVFVHTDSTVDIAVVPGMPDESKFDFKFLPNDYLTSQPDFKNLGISEGSDIFFTGLFLPHVGEHKNYPVVRFGKVAMITDEKISWEGTKADLYLVESSSYGGNSGSPVFFYLGSNRVPGSLVVGPPVLKLAGIMKGFFGEPRAIQFIETGRIPVAVSNIGIAAVVPAYLLSQILSDKELVRLRGF